MGMNERMRGGGRGSWMDGWVGLLPLLVSGWLAVCDVGAGEGTLGQR